MYKIVKYPGRTPKWYDKESNRIKCCFCDNSYQLEGGDYPSRHGAYVCPSCEKEMKNKYQYTWEDFGNINNPSNTVLYKENLIPSLFEKHKIMNERFLFDLNEEFSIMCPICRHRHMPKDDTGYYNICISCAKEFPGYKETIESGCKSLIVEPCEKHGFYITGQQNKNFRFCPVCSKEKRTVKCEMCYKSYVSDDFHFDRIEKGETINICKTCKDTLDGEGSIVRFCDNCNKYIKIKNNLTDKCPTCNKILNKYKIVCKNCGKESYVSNPSKVFCDECTTELNKSENVKKWEDMKTRVTVKVFNDIVTIPIRSFEDPNMKINKVSICGHCGRTYVSHGTNSKFCGDCWHLVKCNECHEEYIVTPATYYDNVGENGEWTGFCSLKCHNTNKSRRDWEEKGICHAPGSKKIDYDNISLDDITYENQKISIGFDNIFEYSVPGVWYREDEFGNVIQVSQTTNIYNEWLLIQKIIDKVMDGSKLDGSYKKMKDDGIDLSKTRTYILLNECYDDKRRFDVEAKFAMDTKCKYWRMAPGYQSKLISNAKKKG